MKAWRLLDTGALPAALNMGVDLALLELHARGLSPPTLRFYRWSPPAISLGYFQRRHGIDAERCREMGLDVVRRASGGHAVLHWHDLTYCVIAGAAEGISRGPAAAYGVVTGGLQAGFSLLGVETERQSGDLSMRNGDVCFMRFAPGDLLHRGKKFVGSAQAWRRSSMMQHGSIVLEPQTEHWVRLLARSDSEAAGLWARLASRTTSLAEITGRTVEPEELGDAIVAGMTQTLKAEFTPGGLSEEEWALARDMASPAISPSNGRRGPMSATGVAGTGR